MRLNHIRTTTPPPLPTPTQREGVVLFGIFGEGVTQKLEFSGTFFRTGL